MNDDFQAILKLRLYIYIIYTYMYTYVYMYLYIYIYNHENNVPPGYHHNGFMATHAFGHMMYGYIYIYIRAQWVELNII